jgi:hypothetical protein
MSIDFSDKFQLSPAESIFLAKKKWDENVYCGMRMENRNVTFPQTQTILNGVNIPNVTLDDIQAILNMRDAWKFLIGNIQEPLTLNYICKINDFISRNESLEWGVLRNGEVRISGTDYIPPIPAQEKVAFQLSSILTSKVSNTEKALDLFLWGSRSQLFWGGNKRTSLLTANKYLLSHGHGMLTITEKNMSEFNGHLSNFYNTDKKLPLKTFLYNNAIDGITYPNQNPPPNPKDISAQPYPKRKRSKCS